MTETGLEALAREITEILTLKKRVEEQTERIADMKADINGYFTIRDGHMARIAELEGELQQVQSHVTDLQSRGTELVLANRELREEIRALQNTDSRRAGYDLKADECGCNVVMRRYSNPFHRAYYKVSRCEFHENAAAEHRTLRQQLADSEAAFALEVEARKFYFQKALDAEVLLKAEREQLAARDEEILALKGEVERKHDKMTRWGEANGALQQENQEWNDASLKLEAENTNLKAALGVAEEAIRDFAKRAYAPAMHWLELKELRGGK